MTTKIKHIASNIITTAELDTSSLDSHFSGGTGVTYSGGAISIGQAVAASDSPTFADLTITGNLNITGNIDQYNVTDLDVTDKTITLGSGQIEANSGGSGIIIDGSSASLLWDETNTEWDFNNPINVSGGITAAGNISSGAVTATVASANPKLKAAYNSSNYIGISHEKINVQGGGVGLIIQGNGVDRATFASGGGLTLANGNLTLTSGEILVGNTSSRFAENNLRFKSSGAAYIDHNTTGQAIKFRTSNSSSLDTNAMTILGSGNVDVHNKLGVNIDSDSTAIFRAGWANSGATRPSTLYSAMIETNSDQDGLGLFTTDNRNVRIIFGSPTNNVGGQIVYNTDTTAPHMKFLTNGSEVMTLKGGVLYIGSGHETSSPSDGIIAAAYASGYNNAGGDLELYGGRSTGDNGGGEIRFFTGAAASPGTQINAHTRRMTIDADGNVGIGTASPNEKLEVSGTALVENTKLKAISKTQSDSATDVFVYDTRKDSDGGAWRKSSTNTSWYNEPSGAKRSSRKEFPVVAVLAFDTSQNLWIYDGDDPDLPLWAKYSNGFTQDAGVAAAVTAKNGAIYCSQRSQNLYSGNGYFRLDFAGDFFFSNIGSVFGTYRQGKSDGLTTGLDFRSRGDRTTPLYAYNSGGGHNINDIAITVLPNSPIDENNGLPRVTIALATDNGVMVILPNEDISYLTNTQDGSAFNYIDNIFFREDNSLVWHGDSASNVAAERFTQVKHKLFSYNFNQSSVENGNTDEQYGPSHKNGNLRFIGTGGITSSSPNVDNGMALSNNAGLNLISPYTPNGEKGLMAHITSDYNTGWMFSKNIRRALLSSTDSTNLVGTNVCPNGDFSNGTTSWSGNQATISASSGVLTVTGTGTFAQNQSANHTAIACNHGDQFFVEFTINEQTTNPSSAGIISSGKIERNNNVGYWYPSTTGTFSTRITANGSSITVYLHAGTAVGVVTKFSNVKITKMDVQDRCHLNHDVYPQGTMVKSPVATGAELQGYGPFSSSNYLQQPYSSHLDFDQGDFCTCFWVNSAYSAAEYIWDRSDDNGNYRIALYYGPSNNGTMFFYSKGSGTAAEVSGVIGNPNEWSQVWVIRRGSSHEIWVNGVNKVSAYKTIQDVSSANGEADLHIGTRYTKSSANSGRLALLRISTGAPSIEQIKKSYDDEKHLFLPNASATIAGSSDAVTALGYDEDTKILHVGTSWGRSSFQGLNRTDYGSTTSIGNAISASNGLIVEE